MAGTGEAFSRVKIDAQPNGAGWTSRTAAVPALSICCQMHQGLSACDLQYRVGRTGSSSFKSAIVLAWLARRG